MRTDTAAMNAIAQTMSGTEWSADTTEAIALIVQSTGRTIADPNDADQHRPKSPDYEYPATPCGCGYPLILTGDGWQHDAAPYLWGDDHDPDGPEPTETTAKYLVVGDVYREDGMDDWETIAELGGHGDTVLITTTAGLEHALDIDLVVEVVKLNG